MIYNNTKRVWRYDTKGDYWVLTLKDGTLRQLGKGLPQSSMMFAKFSPDGTRVAFVSNNNIYVEDVASGQITQLTYDGSQTIVNGTFDWVYEEEFACRDGFRWSPDGQYIAYWQSDTKGTGVFDTSIMWIPSTRPSSFPLSESRQHELGGQSGLSSSNRGNNNLDRDSR